MGVTKVSIRDLEFLGFCRLLLMVHSSFLLDSSSSHIADYKVGMLHVQRHVASVMWS